MLIFSILLSYFFIVTPVGSRAGFSWWEAWGPWWEIWAQWRIWDFRKGLAIELQGLKNWGVWWETPCWCEARGPPKSGPGRDKLYCNSFSSVKDLFLLPILHHQVTVIQLFVYNTQCLCMMLWCSLNYSLGMWKPDALWLTVHCRGRWSVAAGAAKQWRHLPVTREHSDRCSGGE